MGGKAFNDLGENAFPRIPVQVYADLKSRFTERLKSLYEFVGVPIEAPEKDDHGDVDLVVCEPLNSTSCTLTGIKVVLGAQHAILAEGNRTSNFAVPVDDELGYEDDGKFFQVDVHVCSDKAEWERTLFFQSYGDLGMILGLLARSHGFTLGTKGLRTHFTQPDESHISSFPLSESFRDILPFLGLSMEEWERGFSTRASLFSWVQRSRFFEPRRLTVADPAKVRKATRQQRNMYSAFLEFSQALAVARSISPSSLGCERLSPNVETQSEGLVTDGNGIGSTNGPTIGSEDSEAREVRLIRAALLEEALAHFGRKEAYNVLVAENIRRRELRLKLNGTRITEWTGLQGIAVKWVIDGMRERFSEDDIIAMRENKIRELAVDVQTKLGLLFPK